MLNTLKKTYKCLLSQIEIPYLDKIFTEGFLEYINTLGTGQKSRGLRKRRELGKEGLRIRWRT